MDPFMCLPNHYMTPWCSMHDLILIFFWKANANSNMQFFLFMQFFCFLKSNVSQKCLICISSNYCLLLVYSEMTFTLKCPCCVVLVFALSILGALYLLHRYSSTSFCYSLSTCSLCTIRM